jgi:hypothetical protein
MYNGYDEGGANFILKTDNGKYFVSLGNRENFILKGDYIKARQTDFGYFNGSLEQIANNILVNTDDGQSISTSRFDVIELLKARQEEDNKDDKKEQCLIIKKGKNKGKYGLYLGEQEDEEGNPNYIVETDVKIIVLVLEERKDFVLIGDYVKIDDDNRLTEGKIIEFLREDTELVKVEYNKYRYLVDKMNIVDLATPPIEQEEEQQNEIVICKSVTFIENLVTEIRKGFLDRGIEELPLKNILRHFIEVMIFKNSSNNLEIYKALLDACDYDGQKYTLTPNLDKFIELDEKLLKYVILVIKNEPKYFSKYGIFYFFYDSFINHIKPILNTQKVLQIEAGYSQLSFIGETTSHQSLRPQILIYLDGMSQRYNLATFIIDDEKMIPLSKKGVQLNLADFSDYDNILQFQNSLELIYSWMAFIEQDKTYVVESDNILNKMKEFSNLLYEKLSQ